MSGGNDGAVMLVIERGAAKVHQFHSSAVDGALVSLLTTHTAQGHLTCPRHQQYRDLHRLHATQHTELMSGMKISACVRSVIVSPSLGYR